MYDDNRKPAAPLPIERMILLVTVVFLAAVGVGVLLLVRQLSALVPG